MQQLRARAQLRITTTTVGRHRLQTTPTTNLCRQQRKLQSIHHRDSPTTVGQELLNLRQNIKIMYYTNASKATSLLNSNYVPGAVKRARFHFVICSFPIHISTYHLRVTVSIMLIYTTTTSSYQACSPRPVAIIIYTKQQYAFSALHTQLNCVLASCQTTF